MKVKVTVAYEVEGEIVIPDMAAAEPLAASLPYLAGSVTSYDRHGRILGYLHFLGFEREGAFAQTRTKPEYQDAAWRLVEIRSLTPIATVQPGQTSRQTFYNRLGVLGSLIMTVTEPEEA